MDQVVVDTRPLLAGIRTGMSGAQVGRWLGISRERVRQIWARETGLGLPRVPRVSKDPESVRMRRMLVSFSQVGDCWEWAGTRYPTGYGCAYGRQRYAHRAMYEALVGPIPAGLEIDHLCRNRACVNPAHLEPVTHHENMMRSPIAVAAINARKTHCPKGHPYDEANTRVLKDGRGRSCKTCIRQRSRSPEQRAAKRAYDRQRSAAKKLERLAA